MRRRRLAIAAGLGGLLLLALAPWWGGTGALAPAPAATRAADPVPLELPPLGPPEARGDRVDPAAAPVVEAGAVTATGAPGSREDRLAAERARDDEARANRQRLLYDTLTNLRSAADRAEREGDAAYAAALRERADILSRSVRME